jgi:hypothetical protein
MEIIDMLDGPIRDNIFLERIYLDYETDGTLSIATDNRDNIRSGMNIHR